MQASMLLGCFVLAATEYFLSSAYMIPDDSLYNKKVITTTTALSQDLDVASPPVVIRYRNQQRRTRKQRNKKRTNLLKGSVLLLLLIALPFGKAANLQAMFVVITVLTASVGSSELSATAEWETPTAEPPAHQNKTSC